MMLLPWNGEELWLFEKKHFDREIKKLHCFFFLRNCLLFFKCITQSSPLFWCRVGNLTKRESIIQTSAGYFSNRDVHRFYLHCLRLLTGPVDYQNIMLLWSSAVIWFYFICVRLSRTFVGHDFSQRFSINLTNNRNSYMHLNSNWFKTLTRFSNFLVY